MGSVWPKISGRRGRPPTNHFSCQKTMMNAISCGVRIWAQFLSFCHNERVWQTESPQQYRVLHYMQSRGKNWSTFDWIITRIKKVNFFETQCIYIYILSLKCVWCLQLACVMSVSCWSSRTCTMPLSWRRLANNSLLLTCLLCLNPGCCPVNGYKCYSMGWYAIPPLLGWLETILPLLFWEMPYW